MKFNYIKINNPTNIDCFLIKIVFEHGDAYSYSYKDHIINVEDKNKKDEVLSGFLEKFNTIRELLNEINYDDIINHELYGSFLFQHDHHWINEYATISIGNIYYFDEIGDKFKVEIR